MSQTDSLANGQQNYLVEDSKNTSIAHFDTGQDGTNEAEIVLPDQPEKQPGEAIIEHQEFDFTEGDQVPPLEECSDEQPQNPSQANGEAPEQSDENPTSTEYARQQEYAEMMLAAQQETEEPEQSTQPAPIIYKILSHVDPETPTFNIFVGDLKLDVDENDLIQAFGPCGDIAAVNIFKDPITHGNKGFGFVHFVTKESQMKALSPEFNSGLLIKGRSCRVSPSEQKNTLFVGNLPMEMTQAELEAAIVELIGPGTIVHFELKTGPPPNFGSRGFCFIQFVSHNKADQARKILAQAIIRNRPVNVAWAENRGQMKEVDEDVMAKVKTLYVSNISVTVTEQVLVSLFSEHGVVKNCVIVRNAQKVSRGFAFVEFEERDQAMKAMQALHGSLLVGQNLSVVLAKPPPPKPSRGPSRANVRGMTNMMRGFAHRGAHVSRVAPHLPLPRGRAVLPANFRGQKTVGKFPRQTTATIPYGPPGITPARIPPAIPFPVPPSTGAWQRGQTHRYQPYPQHRQSYQQQAAQQGSFPKLSSPLKYERPVHPAAFHPPGKQLTYPQSAHQLYSQQAYHKSHVQAPSRQQFTTPSFPPTFPQQRNHAANQAGYSQAPNQTGYIQPGPDHQYYPYKH